MNEMLQDECCLESQTQGCCEGGRRPSVPFNQRNNLKIVGTPTATCTVEASDSNRPEGWEDIEGVEAAQVIIPVDFREIMPQFSQEQKDKIAAIADGADKVAVYSTGAKRSTDADSTRYDLVSPIGLRRLAETYAEGAAKYGDWNWLKGFPTSVVLNHLQKHIEQWKLGDTTEDHLAHAAWGLFALMHYEEASPEHIQRPLVKVSE